MSATGWLAADLYLTFIAVFVAACALEARARGRSPVAWALIGLIANVVGFVVLMILPGRRWTAGEPV